MANHSCKALSKIGFCNRLLLNPPPPTGFNHRVTNSLPFCTRPIYECTRALFDSWCKDNERTYSSDEEKEYRFKIFQKNCKKFNKHNADPKSTYSMGLNTFSDMTVDECLNKYARVYPMFVARPGPGQVTHVRHWFEWEEHFRMAAESKKLVVVNFMKPWCKECCTVAPQFIKIAKKRRDVIFFKIHAHELKVSRNGTVAEEYKVEKVPAFVFLKEGKEVDRYVGSNIEDLQRIIDQNASISRAG